MSEKHGEIVRVPICRFSDWSTSNSFLSVEHWGDGSYGYPYAASAIKTWQLISSKHQENALPVRVFICRFNNWDDQFFQYRTWVEDMRDRAIPDLSLDLNPYCYCVQYRCTLRKSIHTIICRTEWKLSIFFSKVMTPHSPSLLAFFVCEEHWTEWFAVHCIDPTKQDCTKCHVQYHFGTLMLGRTNESMICSPLYWNLSSRSAHIKESEF
jgi:hypothetical protein